MASDLRFRFSLEKFSTALAYFWDKGVRDLTKLKAMKLLYFVDQYHLFHYGRPVIGDRYIAMDHGPVPEGAFQLISRVLEPAEVDDPSRQAVLQQIEVYRGVFNRYKYPILRARKRPDLDVFSDSEIEALDETLRTYGGKSARVLVDLTHLHAAYKLADAGRCQGSSVHLPYEYFFEDAPEHLRRAWDVAVCEQEGRDFADAFQRAGEQALRRRKSHGSRVAAG